MKNVVVIEDTHKLLDKEITISANRSLFQEPMDIDDIEEWEDILAKKKIPYVLAQLDVEISEKRKSVWKNGYMIFLRKEDLSNNFSCGEITPATPSLQREEEEDDYKVLL